ncbi:conjugative transposon protein TraM [Cellulophaga sp. BC115SP]|uniref:conjugative transposon protein TraM n=1 Tax=Cellulophaga sp. BC115SP TaxID=2683263 RepID=UPI0014129569|nr:conjugative transposon protein TraM [Cellulophaga sp. BC115SP]NBB29923.1 conjugative transposon protein TraM [Cellulophaga sp. BC115SP]
MNNFFNLRLLKYPLSLLIIGLGVGIFFKVFPPTEESLHKDDFGKGIINLNLANSDSTISEKKLFNEEVSSSSNPNTYLGTEDSLRRKQIESENRVSNFRRETSYQQVSQHNRPAQYSSKQTYSTRYESPQPTLSYAEVSRENATIEQLRRKLSALEKKQQVDSVQTIKVEQGIKKDKNGFLIIDQARETRLDLSQEQSNGFYSNGRRALDLTGNYSLKESIASNSTAGGSQLIKGRLMEDKTVRDNSSVKIMVLENSVVNGISINKGQVIQGKCVVNGDRLQIGISGFVEGDMYYQLEGRVLDVDGGEGLNINSAIDMKLSKRAWGQNTSSALGSVNPLLVYQPTGNIGTTVANQVVGSLVNQSLNGANQYLNAKLNDIKAHIKAGQLLYIQVRKR